MREGERQVAPTREGIRRDHVARYEWACGVLEGLPLGSRVIDFGCGVGYGAQLLAQHLLNVTAIDRDVEAIAYAGEHYKSEHVVFAAGDEKRIAGLDEHAAAIAFEVIEHLEDPLPLLKALRAKAPRLLASVPNEAEFPYQGHAYHFRHYTRAEFEALLAQAGWKVTDWFGQHGPDDHVEPECEGRTLIAAAKRLEVVKLERPARAPKAVPQHVAIVGLGPSAREYLRVTQGLGGRHKYCDETWAINGLGDVLACDRIFHMDDVRIQEIRAQAGPESNIAAMLAWMRTHPGPIVTSRAHPDYPGLVEFPLEEVLNRFPNGYFNSTAAYAVAYALYLGVEKISLFGMDFTYPDAHDAEKGRACVEYWLGHASQLGVKLAVAKTSSLLDAIHPQAERFYGYDTLELEIQRVEERIRVAFTERATLPSAAEIEARYDHGRHPSPLMRAVA